MHQERKNSRIFLADAIEHHHCDDGKVPRSGAVGRRNHHGDTAYHEHHQSGQEAQVVGKVEAEEGQIEMQEIAQPDSQCIAEKQQFMLHMAQRQDTHPHILEDAAHPGKNRHIAHQEKHQADKGYQACNYNIKVSRGEHMRPRLRIGSGLLEERPEHGSLQQERPSGDDSYAKRINETLGDHSSQRLGKTGAVVLGQNTAP